MPTEDPVARETAEVIREWGQLTIVNFQVLFLSLFWSKEATLFYKVNVFFFFSGWLYT